MTNKEIATKIDTLLEQSSDVLSHVNDKDWNSFVAIQGAINDLRELLTPIIDEK